MNHGYRKIHGPWEMCLRRLLPAALPVLALATLFSWNAPAHAQDKPAHRLAVLPFEIDDNSGEVGPADRHDKMLSRVTQIVAEEIAQKGVYRIVPEQKVMDAIAKADPGTDLRGCNGCESDIGKIVGADRVMIGWFFKMSTLVMTLHVVVKDVSSGEVVYAHVFDFRGDNEKAWRHAANYMIRSLAKRTRQDTGTN